MAQEKASLRSLRAGKRLRERILSKWMKESWRRNLFEKMRKTRERQDNESLQQTPKAWSSTVGPGENSALCGFDAAGLLNSMLDWPKGR